MSCALYDAGIAFEISNRYHPHERIVRRAVEAGVRISLGSDGPVEGIDDARAVAKATGYPLLIKAASGGGGRGMKIVRAESDEPGLFAVSRFDPVDGHEILVAFNTSTEPLRANVKVDARSARFHSLAGACPSAAAAPGSLVLSIPPLSYLFCEAAASR